MTRHRDLWNDGSSQSTAMSLATTITIPKPDVQSRNKVYQSLHAEPVCATDRVTDVRTWIDSVGHVTCSFTISRDIDANRGSMDVDLPETVEWLKKESDVENSAFPHYLPMAELHSPSSIVSDDSFFADELFMSLAPQPQTDFTMSSNPLDRYLNDNRDVCQNIVLNGILEDRMGGRIQSDLDQYLERHRDTVASIHLRASLNEDYQCQANRGYSSSTSSRPRVRYDVAMDWESPINIDEPFYIDYDDIDDDLLPPSEYFRAHAIQMRREYGAEILPNLMKWWAEQGRSLDMMV